MEFWKRVGNSKTAVVRVILKCFVPCIRRRARSPKQERSRNTQENKPLEHCKEPTHRRMCDRYETLIRAERRRELIDIQKMTREKGKFWRWDWAKISPHRTQFDGTSSEEAERGRRTEERGLRLSDLKIIEHLGEGRFGNIVLAKKGSTGGQSSSEEVFALKYCPNKLVSNIEKEVLLRAVGHPFLVQLLTFFPTKESLCYVMEYVEGGTIRSLLSRLKRFNEDMVRFYAAEIILALNFLHKCDIVHRDIKPENVLLDRDGHCKLAHFEMCKIGMFTWSRTSGECGTEPYMAPEIHQGHLCGPEVDCWSVGCMMYEMMLGKCRLSKVCVHRERFPKYLTQDAVSVLKMFLHPHRRLRLGALGDTRSILRHPFFKKVNWEAVLQKRVTPPVKPPTLEFLNIDPTAPGVAEDTGRTPSTGDRHQEAILEAPLNEDAQLVLEAPSDLDTPAEQDAAPEHVNTELSALEEEVEVKKMLKQKDVELEQLYVKRMHCAAATGQEVQLLGHEENPPHFSLWRKIKLVAGGVLVGLVAFVLTVIEIEIEFTDKSDWKICVELE